MNVEKQQRREVRRAHSEQVALACVAAGLLSPIKLHVGRKASAQPVHHSGDVGVEKALIHPTGAPA